MSHRTATVQALCPDREVLTRQQLPYFIGISGATVGATGLSMHLVVIPPGARAAPHVHVGYETGIYVLEGTVLTRWGAALEHETVSRAGEFLFVPPGVPHEAVNLSATEAARAVVARNDPAEQDKVEPYDVGRAAAGAAGGAPSACAVEVFATDTPPEESLAAVDEGLERHNQAAAPLRDVRPLAAFARDASGALAGGAVGRTWGSCCELLQLWVDPARQRAGIGSRLLQAFEAHARGRGCRIFYLTTLSFQAPEFYRRHGYGVLARIDGYPEGIVKYLMHKTEP